MNKEFWRSTKTRAVRKSAEVIDRLALHKAGLHLLRFLRQTPLTAWALRITCGYRRTFSSFQEANACARSYLLAGPEHTNNAIMHLELAKRPRPSDYAALFHIAQHKQNINTVFDLGGNVGNVFYCYDQMLSLPKSVTWIVYDLPAMLAIGKKLAEERGEDRLLFTSDFRMASGADLLLASGSMHYFEIPLPELVSQLPQKPRYIIINRTPLIYSQEAVTVQDGGSFLVACKLFNRENLIRLFLKAGYRLIDSWEALELSLRIPADPEHSAPSYSGLYFQLVEPARGNT